MCNLDCISTYAHIHNEQVNKNAVAVLRGGLGRAMLPPHFCSLPPPPTFLFALPNFFNCRLVPVTVSSRPMKLNAVVRLDAQRESATVNEQQRNAE